MNNETRKLIERPKKEAIGVQYMVASNLDWIIRKCVLFLTNVAKSFKKFYNGFVLIIMDYYDYVHWNVCAFDWIKCEIFC